MGAFSPVYLESDGLFADEVDADAMEATSLERALDEYDLLPGLVGCVGTDGARGDPQGLDT